MSITDDRAAKVEPTFADLCAGGLSEIREGLANWRIWHLIGTTDLRRRYTRSRLGQAWLVLSMGATVGLIGWVWGALWKVPIAEMMVFVGVGLVMWTFFTGILADVAQGFHLNAHLFANQYLAKSTVIFAIIYKHLILLAHNSVVIVVLLAIFGPWPSMGQFVWLPVGLLLVCMFAYWSGFILSALGARFRDISQIVTIVIQFGFFVTPILWMLRQAPKEVRDLLDFSPFYHMLEVLRGPIAGSAAGWLPWTVMAVAAFGGLIVTLPLIGYLRHKVVYWL